MADGAVAAVAFSLACAGDSEFGLAVRATGVFISISSGRLLEAATVSEAWAEAQSSTRCEGLMR